MATVKSISSLSSSTRNSSECLRGYVSRISITRQPHTRGELPCTTSCKRGRRALTQFAHTATFAAGATRAVSDALPKHMLVDGFDIVIDLKRSKGSYLVDARDGKRYLDFFTFVASSPARDEPSEDDVAGIPGKAGVRRGQQTLQSPTSTPPEQAEFVETFARVAMPAYLPHALLHRRRCAGGRERAEGGVRLEDPEELRAGVQGRARDDR